MKLILLFLFMILNCLCIVSTKLITEINCPPGTRREPNVFNPGSPDVCIPEGAVQWSIILWSNKKRKYNI
jgi:hypothetical protein